MVLNHNLDPTDPRLLQPSTVISQHELAEYRAAVEEQEKRQCEALKLYEPTPFQERFHSCTAKERAIIAGNQVGKSLAGFIEDARAVLGADPHDKYPKKDGVLVCLGMDEGHIGRNIYRYLFRAGAFYMIFDEVIQRWRAWKPWLKEDMDNIAKRKMAPPLIPERMIKNISYKKRGARIFDQVELHNGWRIYAMSSKGEPAAGFVADIVHIDEDIERSDWYDEMIARLTMRNGKLIWTALPLARNDALVNVIERAEDEEKDGEEASTVVFRATVFDNPYMPEKAREENIKRWKKRGEDEYRKRALGELVIDTIKMYPMFSKDIHGFSSSRVRHDEQLVVKLLKDNGWEPPEDWCKYMIFDPGHTVGAVLFVTTPPPVIGDFIVAYDELYLRNCDVNKFGTEVEKKAAHRYFEDFIIDAHGGRLRELASGTLPRRKYEEELANRGIKCSRRGSRFMDGSSDIKYREMRVREIMYVRGNGTPQLLVNTEKCPNLCREIERFKKKMIPSSSGLIPSDDGNRKANTHLVECLEYAAAHGCQYVKPNTPKKLGGFARQIIEGRKRRAAHRKAQQFYGKRTYISLGPSGGSSSDD